MLESRELVVDEVVSGCGMCGEGCGSGKKQVFDDFLL